MGRSPPRRVSQPICSSARNHRSPTSGYSRQRRRALQPSRVFWISAPRPPYLPSDIHLRWTRTHTARAHHRAEQARALQRRPPGGFRDIRECVHEPCLHGELKTAAPALALVVVPSRVGARAILRVCPSPEDAGAALTSLSTAPQIERSLDRPSRHALSACRRRFHIAHVQNSSPPWAIGLSRAAAEASGRGLRAQPSATSAHAPHGAQSVVDPFDPTQIHHSTISPRAP